MPYIEGTEGIYVLLRDRVTKGTVGTTTLTALSAAEALAVLERAEAAALRKQLHQTDKANAAGQGQPAKVADS